LTTLRALLAPDSRRRALLRRLPQRSLDNLRRTLEELTVPPDLSPDDIALYDAVAPYTMTSPERVAALREVVRYTVASGIDGSFVECGVWRGGSMMAVALTLRDLGIETADLFLFDTFGRVPAPTDRDVIFSGESAASFMRSLERVRGRSNVWITASREEVAANLESTGYPMDRVHLVPGRVEDTIPDHTPSKISLLRLDTDWYESVRHELVHLYGLVAPGGPILVDDYGFCRGARDATEEFLSTLPNRPYLHRIDFTGRLFFKP
jgi:O-methyltransferase